MYVEDAEDHLVRSISYRDSAGQVYGPYSRLATTYAGVNMVSVNYGLGATSPLTTPGLWSYRVEWFKPARPRQASIVITSKSEEWEEDYRVRMWTSNNNPLGLYVSVLKGAWPVLGASVHVYCTVLGSNNTVHTMDPIELVDDGNGESDITGDDGVYSKYLINYPSTGRYEFTVDVDDNNQKAHIVKHLTVDEEKDCCGSNTNMDKSKLEKTGKFKRIKAGSVITLTEVPDLSTSDLIPPAKISDLKIKVVAESQSLVATWTSPGDDYDAGSVSGYIVLASTEVGNLLNASLDKNTTALLQFARTDLGGMKTSYQFQFSHFDQVFYLGLVGVDDSNNTGSVSNLVSVFMPSLSSTAIVITDEVSDQKNDNIVIITVSVCCSFLLLAIVLLLAILYFLKIYKPSQEMATHQDMMDSNSNCSEQKYSSSHSLMPSTIMPPFISPLSTLGSSTPTYWSASQLLAEHEHRTGAGGPGHGHVDSQDRGCLSTIQEECGESEGVTNLGYRSHLATPDDDGLSDSSSGDSVVPSMASYLTPRERSVSTV